MAFQTPYGHALYELRGHVAWVTLNRPERLNALSGEMHADLREIWIETNNDPEVRVIVVTGTGRGFCVGADMKEESSGQGEGRGGAERRTPMLDWIGQYGHKKYPGLSHFGHPDRSVALPGKPLIAAINGMCAGGGLMFISEGEFAICTEDSVFFDPHVNVSVAAAGETLANVRTRVLPRPVALRIAYQGKGYQIDAKRALELGFVTEIVAADKLHARAMELAEMVAAAPPLVTRAIAASTWDTWNMTYDQARVWTKAYSTQVLESADAKEGILARKQGRKPVWTGK